MHKTVEVLGVAHENGHQHTTIMVTVAELFKRNEINNALTGRHVPGSLPAPPTRVHDARGELQYPRVKNLRPCSHRPSNRLTGAQQSGLYGLDISLTQPNSLENAVRIARIARDRLLAASREEQRIYRSLLSAEGALRDAGGLLLDGFDRPTESQTQQDLGAARTFVRETWREPRDSSAVSSTRPQPSLKTGIQDTDGLRAVLEQVHLNI